jgi:putative transcriptional regulator
MAKKEFITGEELGQKLLAAAREMSAGAGRVVHSPAIAARTASGLSQVQFAALLGVSLRTLQDWEQGRREPSGAAKTLLRVAQAHPEVLRELISIGI